jgi:hypothetical protein
MGAALRIFLTYRRDDSAGQTGRIADRLKREFGEDSLFMDVDTIPLGVDFRKKINDEVARCDVLIAAIGNRWMTDETGQRRLDNPLDFVRIEISAALRRDIPLIPILLDGTKIPNPQLLPDDVKGLADRNGLNVRHETFHPDLDRLVRELRQISRDRDEKKFGQVSIPGPRTEPHPAAANISMAELDSYFSAVTSGIVEIPLTDNQPRQAEELLNRQFAEMNKVERAAIKRRRDQFGLSHKIDPHGAVEDAIGLALSGSGIRSASFCLGVVQVLANRGLFKEIDFLSTVSGGSYIGCFITTCLGGGATQDAIAGPDGPDPIAIRHVRQHATYFTALNLAQAWLMATATLVGMLLNWSAPLFLITLAAALVSLAGGMDVVTGGWNFLFATLAITCLVSLSYLGWQLAKGGPAAVAAGLLAIALAVTAVVVALRQLLFGYDFAIDPHHWTRTSGLVATLITAGPAIICFIPVVKNPAVRKIALQVLLLLAAIIVPLIAIALFYFLVHFGSQFDSGIPVLLLVSAGCALYAFLGLNINLTGPHRLYRDQLARTFVQFDDKKTDPVWLAEINGSGYAPCHLINTALNVPSSQNAALRERKSDFFLFSKEFSGSPATGYFPTKDWQTNSAQPDLATAMAISGAESSYMKLGLLPTAILTFLNVRFGFWIKQPNQKRNNSYPGFLCLMREIFGFSMSEKNAWLNLSDGGHIDNLAIYELLRRRCKLIISVDGEADPTYNFQGLMTLVRRAQIDFGARIAVDLSDIRPDPKTGYSQAHAALCTIRYSDGSLGFIIYMKPSVMGTESEMIRRYRSNHPDFPHRTTLDQFFDEEQFELYRQLGVHVANDLFSPALMDQDLEIDSVAKWFRKLAMNLLPKARWPAANQWTTATPHRGC